MAIEGPDKDRVVVLGDGVDSAELVKSLRKNVGNASIVSLQKISNNNNNTQDDDQNTSYASSNTYFGSEYPQHMALSLWRLLLLNFRCCLNIYLTLARFSFYMSFELQ